MHGAWVNKWHHYWKHEWSRPFTHTGIDYAGLINIRTSSGRGQKTFKGYIAIFVCLSIKAIHIEAVSNLTSTAFITALRWFASRRGQMQTHGRDQFHIREVCHGFVSDWSLPKLTPTLSNERRFIEFGIPHTSTFLNRRKFVATTRRIDRRFADINVNTMANRAKADPFILE